MDVSHASKCVREVPPLCTCYDAPKHVPEPLRLGCTSHCATRGFSSIEAKSVFLRFDVQSGSGMGACMDSPANGQFDDDGR